MKLYHIITNLKQKNTNKSFYISFKQLFKTYTTISNKLINILIQTQKQKLLTFPNKILFQKKNNNIIITLFKIPSTQ